MAKKTGRPRLYANARDRKRAQRAREAASRAHQLGGAPPVIAVVDVGDPVGALATWAASTLVVPPGHPLSGRPMALPDFATDWLRASWDAHESALSTARKNAKSAIAAILSLGYLVGPLRRPGLRLAVASLDKNKASELRRQVAEIAEASGLDVKVRRSPYPGVIESATGTLDTLSADKNAGHASGYDLVIVDETGLFPLRARELLAGLRSSVSARNGQIRHISIRGDSDSVSRRFLRIRLSCRTSTRRRMAAKLTMRPRGAPRILRSERSRAWPTCAPKCCAWRARRPTSQVSVPTI